MSLVYVENLRISNKMCVESENIHACCIHLHTKTCMLNAKPRGTMVLFLNGAFTHKDAQV